MEHFWLQNPPKPCDALTGGALGLTSNVNFALPLPMYPTAAPTAMGAYRLPNLQAPARYVNGRFYDLTYYAPNDTAAYTQALPRSMVNEEFVGQPPIIPSSYIRSPAAMLHPDVFRAPSAGGFRKPWTVNHAYESPAFTAALYPTLKTELMEHFWLQNPPKPCDVNFVDPMGAYSPDCPGVLFNLGMNCEAATAFYDGSTLLLRTGDVFDDDAKVLAQTNGVDGLWSRDTPFGDHGYYGKNSREGTFVSHHILTTDGIRGRDRLNK
jgi:hypothetical protein